MSLLIRRVIEEMARGGVEIPLPPSLKERVDLGSYAGYPDPFSSMLILSAALTDYFPAYLDTLGKNVTATYLRTMTALDPFSLLREPFSGDIKSADILFDLSFSSNNVSSIANSFKFYDTSPPDSVIEDLEAGIADIRKAGYFNRFSGSNSPIESARKVFEEILITMSELPTKVIENNLIHILKPGYLAQQLGLPPGGAPGAYAVPAGKATNCLRCLTRLSVTAASMAREVLGGLDSDSYERDRIILDISQRLLYISLIEGMINDDFYREAYRAYRDASSLKEAKDRILEIDALFSVDTPFSPFLLTLSEGLLPGVDLSGSQKTWDALYRQAEIVVDALLPVFLEAADSADAYDARKIREFIGLMDSVRDIKTFGPIGAGVKIREAVLYILTTEFPVDRVYEALSDAILDACDV